MEDVKTQREGIITPPLQRSSCLMDCECTSIASLMGDFVV